MASVFRRKQNGPWHVELTDERGRRVRRSTRTKDKRLARQMAANWEREVAERRAGLAPAAAPRDEPAAGLVDAYLADLGRLGRSAVYVRHRRIALGRVAREAGWRRASDLTPRGLSDFLARLGGSGRTANWYRDAAVSFGNWLAESGRLPANPLAGVRRSREARVRHRRALTLDELGRLCAAAPPHRAAVYLLMAYTGFRRGETKALQARDVDRTGPAWKWRLRPEATKSRRAEVLPMTPECQDLLARDFRIDEKKPTDRLVARMPKRATLYRDMGRAGVPTVDPAGRHADFHSLRYTFCTQLARHLPIQTVRLLMRHKDINLTVQVYLDLGLADVAEQLSGLPRLFKPGGGNAEAANDGRGRAGD